MSRTDLPPYIGLLAALLLRLAGCYSPEPEPAPPLIPPIEEPETGTSLPPEGTVASITPSFGRRIAGKRAANSDTVGWLYIPDTTIHREILQNPAGETNDYYLNLSFEGLPDSDGVFCADRRATFGGRGELSRITALYGHSWDDDPEGELFAQLKKYRDPEFAADHPYVFFSTGEEDMVWEVFAVYDTTIYLPYILPDLSGWELATTLNTVYASSYYDYHIDITPEDRLLALSTCTFAVDGHPNLPSINNYRFVVMARLCGPAEPLKEQAGFSVRTSPMAPDATLPLRG